MKLRPADLAAGEKAMALDVKGHRSGQCERMRELVMSVPLPQAVSPPSGPRAPA